MEKKGYSLPSIFGGMNHYDEHGKKIGYSMPSILGGMNHYDEHGKKTGSSYPGILGGASHYDEDGEKTGHSHRTILGGMNHYDEDGERIGSTYPGLFASANHYGEDGEIVSWGMPNPYGGMWYPESIFGDLGEEEEEGKEKTLRKPDTEDISSGAKFVGFGDFAKHGGAVSVSRLQAEQRRIEQYVAAFEKEYPCRPIRVKYDWGDDQVVTEKLGNLDELVQKNAFGWPNPEQARASEAIPFRMSAYNHYQTVDAANLILDELFCVIYCVGMGDAELRDTLADAARYYLRELERLAKKDLEEVQYLILYLNAELCILSGDFADAVSYYNQVLRWDKLLCSVSYLRDDWPCDYTFLEIGAEDFYEALFVNLVNVYAALHLPECCDFMRELFTGVYSWLKRVYTNHGRKAELEKIDARETCKGFDVYNWDFKSVLNLMEKPYLKDAKRARLFRQNLVESDGRTTTRMQYVNAFILPDYSDWYEEQSALSINGGLIRYDLEKMEQQREQLLGIYQKAAASLQEEI